MAEYVIDGVDVTDPDAYATYSRDVPATLEPSGGGFVARGGDYEVLVGELTAPRLVVIEFPDHERATVWHASDAYQKILPIRQANARTSFMVAVDSLP